MACRACDCCAEQGRPKHAARHRCPHAKDVAVNSRGPRDAPSYGGALSDLGMTSKHITGGRSNGQAETSHLPARLRERRVQRFRSAGSAQRFLSTHAAIYNSFNVQRHLISRQTLRQIRSEAMRKWQVVTAAAGRACSLQSLATAHLKCDNTSADFFAWARGLFFRGGDW